MPSPKLPRPISKFNRMLNVIKAKLQDQHITAMELKYIMIASVGMVEQYTKDIFVYVTVKRVKHLSPNNLLDLIAAVTKTIWSDLPAHLKKHMIVVTNAMFNTQLVNVGDSCSDVLAKLNTLNENLATAWFKKLTNITYYADKGERKTWMVEFLTTVAETKVEEFIPGLANHGGELLRLLGLNVQPTAAWTNSVKLRNKFAHNPHSDPPSVDDVKAQLVAANERASSIAAAIFENYGFVPGTLSSANLFSEQTADESDDEEEEVDPAFFDD